MARLDDALGLFSDQSYVNPEAPPTDNGLDPITGWARGVIEDPNSASGYSYNGIPVNTDGSRFEPRQTTPTQYPLEPTYSGSGSLGHIGDIFQSLFKGRMPQAPAPTTPVSQFAHGGDFAQPAPQQPIDPYLQMADQSTSAQPAISAISDFANRMTPQLPPTYQEPNQQFIDIDRALDTTSGVFNPNIGTGVEDPLGWNGQPKSALPASPMNANPAVFGPLGKVALTAMDAPRKYGVGPFVGNLAQELNSPQKAISGLLDIPGLLGRTAVNTVNPKDNFAGYKSGMKTNEDFLNNEEVPWLVRNVARSLEDPLTYAGGVGLDEAARGVGGKIGGFLEQGAAKNIVTSNLGSEVATRYGENVPGFNKQPEFVQGLEGAVLGFGAPGAIKNGVRLIDSTSKGVVNGMVKLDSLINEPAGSLGAVTAGQEFRTGLGPDGSFRPFKRTITEGTPVTNDDLQQVTFVHSTRDYGYNKPDPEYGVKAITQLPGTYLTTDYTVGDPSYGDRAFTSEFDGHAMILADEANPQEWENIASQIAEKLHSIGVTPKATLDPFGGYALDTPRWSVEKTSTNNYGYRDALVDAIQLDIQNSWTGMGFGDKIKDKILTRFKGVDGNSNDIAKAVVSDTVADNGYDAFFHRSTADGDTLIVLNGDSMRVTGELHKGHGLIEDGMTVRDVMEKIDTNQDWKPKEFTLVKNGEYEGRPIFDARDADGKTIGMLEENADGTWRGWTEDGSHLRGGPFTSLDEVKSALSGEPVVHRNPSLRDPLTTITDPHEGTLYTVRQTGDGKWGVYDERGLVRTNPTREGAEEAAAELIRSSKQAGYVEHLPPQPPSPGSFLNKLSPDEGSSTAAFAARTGIGAAAGAGIAESQGDDWKKGAAIGAGLGAGMPLLTKGAMKLTHGGMGGSVTQNIGDEADDALNALFKAMNDARKESGGRTFASMDEALESIAKQGATGKITPSHPSPGAALPGFGTEVGGEQLGVFSNPATPSMADKPRLTPTGARRDIVGELPIGTESPRPPGVSEGRAKTDLVLQAQKPPTLSTVQSIEKNILGILGMPMEVFVGGDISAGGRQARMLGQSHPVLWAKSVVNGLKAMDPVKAEKLTNVMRADKDLPVLTDLGNLHLSFLETEEQLGTGLAGQLMEKGGKAIKEKVGGKVGSFLAAPTEYLPATERNYTMTLDWLRYTVAKQMLDDLRKSGVEVTKDNVTDITNYINHKTGYGTGSIIDSAHGMLSVPFLAPRYWLSKYQSMGDTFTMFAKNPQMRPEIIKNTVSYLGTIAALSAVSAYVGGEAGVFQDPRKGAFGSIGGKDLSFDITGGLGTELRNFTRIAKGEKITAGGETKSINRGDATGRFLRGKLSPNAGSLYSLITGKNYEGDPANLTSAEGIKNTARGSIIPLFYQDAYTSFQKEYPGVVENESDFGRLLSAARLLAGVGGSAFGVAPHVELDNQYDLRNQQFEDMFPGTKWEQSTPTQRTAYEAKYGKIEPTSPEAIAAQENRDRQRRDNVAAQEQIDMTFPPGRDWRTARNDNMIAIATKIQENEVHNPFKGTPYESADDVNIREWSNKIKALTPYPGGTNWEALDKWLSENPAIANSVDSYMTDPNKPSTALTTKDQEYKDDSKVIRDSGYWDLKEETWKKILASQPDQLGYKPGQSYDEYRDGMIDKIADSLIKSGQNPTVAKSTAIDKVGEIFPGIGLMDDIYTKNVLLPWIAKNPDAFYLVAKWEYIQNPNKTQAAILNAIQQKMNASTPKPTEIK